MAPTISKAKGHKLFEIRCVKGRAAKVRRNFELSKTYFTGQLLFFQMAIRWIFVKCGNEMLFVPMWLMSVIIGIYAPTLIARVIEKRAPMYARICFGL